MTVPNKPRWLNLKDALTFGLLFVLSVIVTIFVYTADNIQTGNNSEMPSGTVIQARALFTTISLIFFGIYAYVLWMRYTYLKDFIYIRGSDWAMMVHPGKYKSALDKSEILRLTNLTLDGWSLVFGRDNIKDFANNALFWVWFKPYPIIQVRGQKKKVAGVTIGGSRLMLVSYKNPYVPLDSTAFRHEIGHIIQGHITGSWNESEHHARSKAYLLR